MDRLVLPTAVVDFRREEVRGADGTRIDLRPRAFAVLRCLAAHAERLVTKDDLLAECWPGCVVTEDSLTQCVSEIRQALGEDGRDVVRTVPRRGYVLMPPETTASAPESIQLFAPASWDFWPAIAVLPFDEFSDKPGPLGAGIAAEIITELARNRDVRVLSRHTSFGAAGQGLLPADISREYQTRYVVEGSVRCMAGYVVVSVQLIDGHDSRHIWADRFTASADEAFAAQNGLVARIAARLFSEIRAAETIAALRSVPGDLSPHQLTLRAVAHWRGYDRSGYIKARAELERAIVLDPRFAPARICLGRFNAMDAGLAISGDLGLKGMAAAMEDIRHGIQLAPALAIGHQALGLALCFTNDKDEAVKAAERSVALGPGDAESMLVLSRAHIEVGQYASALSEIEYAFAINPLSPSCWNQVAALAHFGLGRHGESAAHAAAATKRTPGLTPAYLSSAAALSALGRTREAHARITELLSYSPGVTVQSLKAEGRFVRDPKTQARYLDLLRDAGLPEGN